MEATGSPEVVTTHWTA